MWHLVSPSLWHIAATVLLAIVISANACGPCGGPALEEDFEVVNEADQTVVVEYLLDGSGNRPQVDTRPVGPQVGPYEEFRLQPGQRGSFSVAGDGILNFPVVVRTVPDGRVIARAPVGSSVEGNGPDLVVR